MKIIVLRLGHRKKRDIRVTTHCCLAARAFLADGIVLSGEEDPAIIETVRKVVSNWGGRFEINYKENWRKFLKVRKTRGWKVAHLTMYGEMFDGKVGEIVKAAAKGLVVVVGAEKVPPDIYSLADFNISITNQPHSEIAALGVFLCEIKRHEALGKSAASHFSNAKIVIRPGMKGKKK